MTRSKISYTEFNDIITNFTLDLGYVLPEYETVVKFYSIVKDKFSSYIITDYTSGVDYATINILESFGINFSEKPISIVNRLLVIDPSTDMDVGEIVRDYYDTSRAVLGDSVENYRPTHFVVLTSDITVVDYYYNQLIKFYGSLTRVQYKIDKLDSSHVLNNVLVNLNRLGMTGEITANHLLDVQDYCANLRSIKSTTVNGLNELNKIVEEIHSKANRRIICNLSPISYPDQVFAVLAVELYLRYGIRFYAQPTELESICSIVMNSLFNIGHQLFEDAVAYFRNLPDALVSLENFGTVYHTIDHTTQEMVVEVAYAEAKGIPTSESHLDTFSIDDIVIEPLFNYYDLNSATQCKSLKETFMNMYRYLDIHSDIIDVSRVLFFYKKENGVVDKSRLYQGFVNSFKCKVKTVSISPGSDPCEMEIDYDKLRQCYPLTIFLDGQSEISKLVGHKVNWDTLAPFYKKEPMSVFLSNRIITRDFVGDFEVPISLVWFKCGNSVEFRKGFYRRLVDFRGLAKTREFLDVFGFASKDLVNDLHIGGYSSEE